MRIKEIDKNKENMLENPTKMIEPQSNYCIIFYIYDKPLIIIGSNCMENNIIFIIYLFL